MEIRLLCEYMQNPTGVDTAAPLLSWCADAPETVMDAACLTLWDAAGRILWQKTVRPDEGRIAYSGQPLKSGRTYRWQVKLMYEGGECTSQEAQFTMGLLQETPMAGRMGGRHPH